MNDEKLIRAKIIAIITVLHVPLNKVDSLIISDDTTFNELGMDSLDCLELIIDIEDEFDITIANAHVLRNLGDLVKIVEIELKK